MIPEVRARLRRAHLLYLVVHAPCPTSIFHGDGIIFPLNEREYFVPNSLSDHVEYMK
jgi:hypothetical protein